MVSRNLRRRNPRMDETCVDMPSDDWPFRDPPNTAVMTTRAIVEEQQRIHYVFLGDDGWWQFHAAGPVAVLDDARIVSLALMLQMDPTLRPLSDLPAGWRATRDAPDGAWLREDYSPAYTLDSAVDTHNEFPDTFEIPQEADRRSLRPGDFAKLMFRFKASTEVPVERMWVKVEEVRPESYLGVLDNEPYFTKEIRLGLRLEFSPDDVIQIRRRKSLLSRLWESVRGPASG